MVCIFIWRTCSQKHEPIVNNVVIKGSFGMEKRNGMESRNDIWRVRNGT